MNAANLRLIHRLIEMGTTSLLQYVSEAVPWSADAAHVAIKQVDSIAQEERAEVARLTRLLQKRHLGLAKTGSYPSQFTTINYVTIDYLLPRLVAEGKRDIAELQARLQNAGDEEVRAWIQVYLDMKARHLLALQKLTASPAPGPQANTNHESTKEEKHEKIH